MVLHSTVVHVVHVRVRLSVSDECAGALGADTHATANGRETRTQTQIICEELARACGFNDLSEAARRRRRRRLLLLRLLLRLKWQQDEHAPLPYCV